MFILIFATTAVDFAWAQTLKSVTVAQVERETQVELAFNGPAPKADSVFQTKNGTPRLVFDWTSTRHAIRQKTNSITGAGLIKAVRFSGRGNGMRVVFDLARPDVSYAPVVRGNLLTVVLKSPQSAPKTILAASTSSTPKSARRLSPQTSLQGIDVSAPRYFKSKTPYPRLKPFGAHTAPKPVRKPVIVIDPGHGGYDPGALGAAGTQEKAITYAASRELKKQLERTGRYKVVITRNKDIYVAHEERLRIARAGGADLFISLHADATQRGSARGASVYTLADRAINRSKRLVNSQNWILDVDLSEQSDPVGDILVDLAQRKTATQSSEFADVLIEELKSSTMLIGNSHRRAGYYVLLAPDVPAVLLELGFLSNAQDEALLNTPAHRKKVISSVTRAINRYFAAQKP